MISFCLRKEIITATARETADGHKLSNVNALLDLLYEFFFMSISFHDVEETFENGCPPGTPRTPFLVRPHVTQKKIFFWSGYDGLLRIDARP